MITDRRVTDSGCTSCGSGTRVREFALGRDGQAKLTFRLCETCRDVMFIVLRSEVLS